MNFENKLSIGNGIYTVPDVARILRLPYNKVNTWLNEYWDGKLGKTFKGVYSWKVDSTRAVGFHTLVEFYVMMQFSEAGVKPAQVLFAHSELSKAYNTIFPFAQKQVIDNIHTDGKRIYINVDGVAMSLDGSKQLKLFVILNTNLVNLLSTGRIFRLRQFTKCTSLKSPLLSLQVCMNFLKRR